MSFVSAPTTATGFSESGIISTDGGFLTFAQSSTAATMQLYDGTSTSAGPQICWLGVNERVEFTHPYKFKALYISMSSTLSPCKVHVG